MATGGHPGPSGLRGRMKEAWRAARIVAPLLLAAPRMAAARTGVAAPPEAVELRGYGGKVSASFGGGEAVFECGDAAVARRLYAKLLRDLEGLCAIPPEREGNRFRFASGHEASVGMRGARTVVVTEDPAARLDTPPPEVYPPYLDYYDLRALKFYKRPMESFLGYGVENHWAFAEKCGIGGLVSHGIDVADTLGPGVFSYIPWDFAVGEAAKAGSMLTLSPTFAGQMPMWMFNRHPEKCARPQRHTLVTEWIQGVEGMAFDNDGPGFPDERSPLLAFEKATIERYVDSPGLGGWQFYCGKPIGDQMGPGMFGILWDSSEEGLAAQREWLRGKYGLGELSRRWTGDPAAYGSWGDVPDMQLVDLIGGDWDPDRLDLFDGDWQWAKAPEQREWKGAAGWVEDPAVEIETPPPAGTRWLPVRMPPSHRCNYVESGRCWYRLALPQGEWLGTNKGRDLHLRLVMFLADGARFAVWANGVKSVSDRGGVLGMLGARIPAGTFRNDGTDEIVVEMPGGRSCGRIAGPVSLSPTPARNYPYDDPRVNARYLDNMDFQETKIGERMLKVFLAGRALDPDRPISLSGGSLALWHDLAPIFAANGIAMQSTSTDGFYWPDLPDMGRQHGFYFIGEPSSDVADGERFDRNFGTIFYTGASSTAVFMDIEQYMEFEEKTGGMTARRPVTRLVGKYLVDEPRIAFVASGLSRTDTAYEWNLLRGELQGVHYDGTMTTERELEAGIVTPDKYPLVFDCGADVMDDAFVDAIGRYVREGGTFVAFTETGRHTPLIRDAHPFARVSGFRTRDFEPGNVEVAFAEDETLFPIWAGKRFPANGSGAYTQANWKWNRMLEKVAPDAEVVAVWSPSGKPAVGVRAVGKGRVITIASGFWREARDIRGKWLPSRYNEWTSELLGQLGAARVTDSPACDVWTRKATSKSGLEDWLIAFNVAVDANGHALPRRTPLSFRVAERPMRVCDAFTGEEVQDWRYEDGFVTLPEIDFHPFQTRIFAAVRPTSVPQALPFWWAEKVKYWKAGPKLTPPNPKMEKDDGILVFDQWEFSADGGKTWRDAKAQTWKLQFPDLRDYCGPAIYRARFRAPKAAPGSRLVIRHGYKTLYDKADLFLNGVKFGDFDQAKVHRELCGDKAADVTDLLDFDGENLLEVRIEGAKLFTAGVCDVVWMEAEPPFGDSVSLDGDWEAVGADFFETKPATVPGKSHCRFLRRRVDIPAEWAGKKIFVRVVQPGNVIGSIVINGQGRNLGGLRPFGTRELINVTDLVKPGETNEVEIWHRRTVPVDWKGKAWGWAPEDDIAVTGVELGTVGWWQ